MTSKKSLKNKSRTTVPRPPVVAVLGHVDHGKTTLLDVIRKTAVAQGEAGGITQHIGAYQVKVKTQSAKGKTPREEVITFIDTPGHEAFSKMRARGGRAADIALLVVAADDGVAAQTLEALNHIGSAKIPFVVVISKTDLPGGNPQKVKNQLLEHGVAVEGLGGQIVCCPVSAKEGRGLNELLGMILLVAEMEELKADPLAPFEGVVIESQLDRRRGPVATVLAKSGTLRVGAEVFCGGVSGKIKAMMNDRGERIKEAPPSTPVEILGLAGVCEVGAKMEEREGETKERKTGSEIKRPAAAPQASPPEGGRFNLVLKADTQGTLEAVKSGLEKAGTGAVQVEIVHSGVGDITDSDVLLAAATSSLIVGFNVRLPVTTKELADHEKVKVKNYQIIYELLEEVKKIAEGVLLGKEEKIRGRGEVRAVFPLASGDVVAGTGVVVGQIKVGDQIKVLREGEEVWRGQVRKIKQGKEAVKKVEEGQECGINIRPRFDMAAGDVIEVL